MSFIIIAAFLGIITGLIAQSKGRSFAAWWLYGTLLFIIAIVHVLVIPSKNNESKSLDSMRKCDYCAEPIRIEAVKCKHCSSELRPLTDEEVKVIERAGNGGYSGTQIAWKRIGLLILVIAGTGFVISCMH